MDPTPVDDTHNKNSEDGYCDTPLPMNYTARLKTRSQWFANERVKPAKELKFRPARFVVVAHTAGSYCSREVFCENIIKGIQAYHIKKFDDISYNFLIGGDGYIYEGLGWGKYGSHTYGINCASIGVAFIGDYNDYTLSTKQVDSFNLLVKEGVEIGEIIPNYKLLSHSQVINVDSPGLNIKKIIKDWKHFGVLNRSDITCK